MYPLITKENLIGKWTYYQHGEENPKGSTEVITVESDGKFWDIKANGDLSYSMNGTGDITNTKWELINNKFVMENDPTSYVITKLNAEYMEVITDFDVNGQVTRWRYYFKRE